MLMKLRSGRHDAKSCEGSREKREPERWDNRSRQVVSPPIDEAQRCPLREEEAKLV